MTITPVPKPDPTEKQARKLLRTLTPMKRGSSLSRKTPVKKVNRERLDKRTKAYKRYMASEAWAERRLNALIAADYTCQRCEWTPLRGGQPTALGDVIAAPALHIHHRSYRHFGAEQPDELEVVCADCHRKEHAGRFIKPRGLRGGRN